MTLTELVPVIRQLSANDKIKLIRILAEDLDSAEAFFPFEPNKIYYLPTPYDSFGTGEKLAQAMSMLDE